MTQWWRISFILKFGGFYLQRYNLSFFYGAHFILFYQYCSVHCEFLDLETTSVCP